MTVRTHNRTADEPHPGPNENGYAVTARHPSPPDAGATGQVQAISAAKVGGPVAAAWREGTLTRAQELLSLCDWMVATQPRPVLDPLVVGVRVHLAAARDAAEVAALDPKRLLHLPRYGPLRERAISNLDAAEAHLLSLAPPEYLLGQLPSLLQHVRCHLVPDDPRREELVALSRRIGFTDESCHCPRSQPSGELSHEERKRIVVRERVQIVSAVRAASSASLREQVRVRSFRDVLVATTVVMSLLAITLAVTGWLAPSLIPMCFAPQEAGSTIVVCPTQQSTPFATGPGPVDRVDTGRDIDDAVQATVRPWDLLIVELVGLAAAAVAAAAAIRKIRGSSERHGVPLALAALKLPTGAVTAFLGLMLMRGQFVPGLSALDSSAQILAWALVFGYAQQVFTRLVDQQGQTVLNSVRGANKVPPGSSPQ